MRKVVFLVDLHYGYERDVYRHKVALHDPKVMSIALQFIQDFKPDEIILGGDMLDCGCISHHNRHKAGRLEGLRLQSDAEEFDAVFLSHLSKLHRRTKLTYIIGNHEDWLNDLVDEWPGLENIVDIKRLLDLRHWNVIAQGKAYHLGKLTFIHGDQMKGSGETAAKRAVLLWERSVRLGHWHTFSAYTKTSAMDIKFPRTGVLLPCMCTRGPKYGEGKANSWVQGFSYGYMRPDGSYSDYVALIVNNRVIIEGKEYTG